MSAKPGLKAVPWTPEQDESLRQIWPTNKRIKANMDLFGEHTYGAIMTRAYELELGKRPNCPRGQSPIAWKLVEYQLKRNPLNRYRAAERANLDPATTHKVLTLAHAERRVHIFDWERRTKTSALIPVYKLGDGVDKPKPPKLSNVEKTRRARERDKRRRIFAGESVQGFNPFVTAIGQARAPDGGSGRVFQQSMSLRDFDEEAA
jgi:hypothetical protein